SLAPIGAAIAVVVAISPIGALAFGQPNWQANRVSAAMSRGSTSAGRWRAVVHNPATDGPSTVEIAQTPQGDWQYRVDGQATVLQGVGYNPQYAGLANVDREQVYQRD